MKVKVIKTYGRVKEDTILKNMHPSTAETLVEKGLVEVISEESETGQEPDDFNYRIRQQ